MTDRDAHAHRPYRFRPARDLPLIGLGLAVTLIALVEIPPPACLPHCSPDGINPLDALAVGGYSAAALMAANLVVALLVAAPLLLELALLRGRGFWRGALVFGQALVLTQALTQLVKVAVRRPAAFVYTPDLAPDSALNGLDVSRAFFSGHTATAFVAATLLVAGFWLRYPSSRARWPLLVAALITATAAGSLKIVAGYHYPTDVIAGALAGTSIGALVALAHRPRRRDRAADASPPAADA